MTKNFKPANTPDLSIYLIVRDSAKSLEFYTKAFGFLQKDVVKDENGKITHVEMKKGEALIMFCSEGDFGNDMKAPVSQNLTMPITFYIYTPDDLDKLYEKSTQHGAKSKTAPNEGFWGDRYFTVNDPDGYEWSFACKI